MLITSLHNPRIKQVRALRLRKERERTGLFFAEGIHLVVEAFQTDAVIEFVVVAPELLRSPLARQLAERAVEAGRPCVQVSAGVFNDLAQREFTQGIGVVSRQRWETLATIERTSGVGWVALVGAQYPGNLGTILRTADAVQAEGIVLLDGTADPYDPTAVRASVGAIFTRRLARAGFAEFVAWTRARRLPVIGTSPGARADYRSISYQAPLILLMGSEGRGLSPEQLAICDRDVRIPMSGRCDSLNLAVATSLVLYEVLRQQHSIGPV